MQGTRKGDSVVEEQRTGSRDKDHSLLQSWLDLGEAIEHQPGLRQLLFDPVTGLPTTPLLFPRIGSLLEERGEVSLLCINIVRYSRIEEIYGWQAFDEVMREAAEALDEIAGEALRDADIIAELMNSGNAFVIVLSPPRTQACIDLAARHDLARRLEARMREQLEKRIEPALYKKLGCYVGAATVCYDENVRLERTVYDALDKAIEDSNLREGEDSKERTERLRQIVASADIRTLVHPVFQLDSMDIIGYEALSRGPEGSEFERPDKLFAAAYDADLVTRLERVCRKRALEMAARMPQGKLLFVNVEPDSVNDPQLREAMTSEMLAEAQIQTSSIVLELTERAAISDFPSFRSTLDYVRALGFGVAVDNAGAGYGSLRCLAEVKPEWLKIDRSLVQNCDTDEVRASLVRSLVTFAEKVGGRLVAEGVETEAELATLRELGVVFGQGFLLSGLLAEYPDETNLPAKRFAEGSA